eukprot:Phypoly_transcript_10318.p1 GENE.Phypoly_transcript_10318~~Phypoly_transcript_10318.p1  ORF type:complete len:302 (+),score=47.61 Phypoly_transcript_10318:185-1090(+)
MFSMALADLLGASFWFLDMLHSICPLNVVLNLYGYQSAQLWSCIMGAYLILKFSDKRIPPEFIFHIIAWGLPFIPQAFILSMELYHSYQPPQGCWIQFGMVEMAVVAIPQLLTVILNSLFIGFICFSRRKASTANWGFRNRDQSLFLIQIWCFFTAFSSVLQSIPNAPSYIYNISYILGASQGFFHTLAMRQTMVLRFFTWTNTQIMNVKNTLTAPHLLVQIDGSGPIPPAVPPTPTIPTIPSYVAITRAPAPKSPPRRGEKAPKIEGEGEGEEEGYGIAPSAALLIHHRGYHAVPNSDIN